MVRVLLWGKLSKISSVDKIGLILDTLIPASYLRGLNRDKRELNKVGFYRREIKKLLKSPDIEFHEKQEFLYLFKDDNHLLCGDKIW